MKKKSCRGRKKQYQKEKQFYLIFKMLNPCYMINSNSFTQTTAFSLHYIFLFPLCKQWEGAKGHSPGIVPSLHHLLKEQSSHTRGHLSHIAQGAVLVTVPIPSQRPQILLTQSAPWEHHRQLQSTQDRWEAFEGKPCGANSHGHTRRHRNRVAEQRTQPNPNLEDSEHLAWGCPDVTLLWAAAELKPLQLTKHPSCPPRKEES